MSYKRTGVLSLKDLEERNLLPPEKILTEKFVPFVECVERIPCDPCAAHCPTKCIVKDRITDIPKVFWDRCNGCLKCVAVCPGLAIFLGKIEGEHSKLFLPHEMLPVPKKGEKVRALDREGNDICEAEVFSVIKFPDKTYVIGITLEKKFIWNARAIRVVRP